VSDGLVAHVGKGRLLANLDPDDFTGLRKRLAKKWGPHRLKKAIQYIRCLFKDAYDSGLIDRPVRFGPSFKRPSLLAVVQLAHAVIARRPDQPALLAEEAPGDYEEPRLIECLVEEKGEWDTWPRPRLQRYHLLSTLESHLIEFDPEADAAPALACLELLPKFPAP
jgi:hypothetical protein